MTRRLLLFGLLLMLYLGSAYALDLNYWIGPDNSGNPSKVWVKVPEIPANGTATIYMKKEAGYSPDKDSVFYFYFDASTDSFSDYFTINQGAIDDSGEGCTQQGDYVECYSAKNYNARGPMAQSKKVLPTPDSGKWIIEGEWYSVNDEDWGVGTGLFWWDLADCHSDQSWNNGLCAEIFMQENDWSSNENYYLPSYWYQDGAGNFSGGANKVDTVHHVKEYHSMVIDWGAKAVVGGARGTTDYSVNYDVSAGIDFSKSVGAEMKITLFTDGATGRFYWIRVRAYADPMPTVTVTDMGNYYKIEITNNTSTDLTDFQVSIPASELGVTSTTESLHFSDQPFSGISVSLSYSPTEQNRLALDPESGKNEVNVTYIATVTTVGVNVVYYRAYDGDSNTTILEGNDDVNYITFSRTYTEVGDYNTCVYVRAVDDSNNEYEDTVCDVVHIDEYPQALDFDWSNHIPFPSETLEFNGEATDNGTLTYSWDFGDGNTDSGQTVQHAYSSAGTYTVTLTVTDDYNLSKSISKTVSIFELPRYTFTREDSAFKAEIIPDSRLTVQSAEWNVDGITVTGKSISIQVPNRYPTGELNYTLYFADLNATRDMNLILPELNVDFNIPDGFVTQPEINVTYNTAHFLDYNQGTLATVTPTCGVYLNDSNTLILQDGDNELNVACETNMMTYQAIDHFTRYVKRINVVNEETGEPVDLNILSALTVSDNDGKTFDMKQANVNYVYHVSDDDDDFTVEFIYADDSSNTKIMRFFKDSLLDANMPVCIPDFQSFSEVILYSSSVKSVWVQNAVTGCYVLAAQTSYLYQDAYSATFYGISKLYEISTFGEDGSRVVLGTIYATKPYVINLDMLTYRLKQYDISILPTVFSIERESNTSLRIYIKNPAWDNKATTVKVYDPNGNILLNHYETISPNDFQVIFDHSTLNISPDEILKLVVIEEKESGATKTHTWFFKITGENGLFQPEVGAGLSLAVAAISLTSVSTALTFGAVGLLGMLVAFIIAGLSVTTDYIILLQAIYAIALIYIFLIYKNENSGVV